jgi:hypothetical protein
MVTKRLLHTSKYVRGLRDVEEAQNSKTTNKENAGRTLKQYNFDLNHIGSVHNQINR